MSDAIKPAATTLDRIFEAAPKRAMTLANEIRPAFDAA
jgi:hypothetical protein